MDLMSSASMCVGVVTYLNGGGIFQKGSKLEMFMLVLRSPSPYEKF